MGGRKLEVVVSRGWGAGCLAPWQLLEIVRLRVVLANELAVIAVEPIRVARIRTGHDPRITPPISAPAIPPPDADTAG